MSMFKINQYVQEKSTKKIGRVISKRFEEAGQFWYWVHFDAPDHSYTVEENDLSLEE